MKFDPKNLKVASKQPKKRNEKEVDNPIRNWVSPEMMKYLNSISEEKHKEKKSVPLHAKHKSSKKVYVEMVSKNKNNVPAPKAVNIETKKEFNKNSKNKQTNHQNKKFTFRDNFKK